MHLVGYLYDDYHDARSLEHKEHIYVVNCTSFTHLGHRHISPAMHEHIQVKYTLFSVDFEQREVDRGVLFKAYNIKFQKNLYSGSRVVPCGRTDGQTCRNSRVAFANLAKALEIGFVWLMTGICCVPCVQVNDTSVFMK
jgi:hypothetical protein